MLRKLNRFSALLNYAALGRPVVHVTVNIFQSKRNKSLVLFVQEIFLNLMNLEMGQSYKDTANLFSYFFSFCLFMVNMFLSRSVSNFSYDYNE